MTPLALAEWEGELPSVPKFPGLLLTCISSETQFWAVCGIHSLLPIYAHIIIYGMCFHLNTFCIWLSHRCITCPIQYLLFTKQTTKTPERTVIEALHKARTWFFFFLWIDYPALKVIIISLPFIDYWPDLLLFHWYPIIIHHGNVIADHIHFTQNPATSSLQVHKWLQGALQMLFTYE